MSWPLCWSLCLRLLLSIGDASGAVVDTRADNSPRPQKPFSSPGSFVFLTFRESHDFVSCLDKDISPWGMEVHPLPSKLSHAHFPFCDSRKNLGQGPGSERVTPICLPPSRREQKVSWHTPNIGAGGSIVLGVKEHCFNGSLSLASVVGIKECNHGHRETTI